MWLRRSTEPRVYLPSRTTLPGGRSALGERSYPVKSSSQFARASGWRALVRTAGWLISGVPDYHPRRCSTSGFSSSWSQRGSTWRGLGRLCTGTHDRALRRGPKVRTSQILCGIVRALRPRGRGLAGGGLPSPLRTLGYAAGFASMLSFLLIAWLVGGYSAQIHA